MSDASSTAPLAVVGEALVDVILWADGETTDHPGGSCLNVAVAASRLDLPTLLVTQLAPDEHGDLLRAHAEDSGVRVHATAPTSGRTSTATATVDEHGSASYSFDLDWTLPATALPPCAALHTGSLGSALEPGNAAVADLVEQAVRAGVLVSYDPNARPAFIDDADAEWAAVRERAARADLVKLSDEDCEILAPGRPVEETAAALLEGRPRLVVLTRGGSGAVGLTEGTRVEIESPRVEVADTVGAGDTFTAGLLVTLVTQGLVGGESWHRDEATVRGLLTAAARAAAVTVSRPGADPPRRSDLEGWPGLG